MGEANDDWTLLTAFACHLAADIALPQLSRGYASLVEQLRGNTHLTEVARREGADALISGDHPTLQDLRKSNREFVTAAERDAERSMNRAVRERYPDHAIVGEEFGYTPGTERRWVFDPVDGTSAMLKTAVADAFDVPLPVPAPGFGVTVALVAGDQAVVGIVIELGRGDGGLVAVNTWAGASGRQTTCNATPAQPPPPPARLRDAALGSTVPDVMFNTPEKWSGYQALAEATRACVPDQNCVGFMRLLQPGGDIDIVYEADMGYHDAAALIPILTGCGITVTDERGSPVKFAEASINEEFQLLAAQPQLHQEALATLLRGVPADRLTFRRSSGAHGYVQKFAN